MNVYNLKQATKGMVLERPILLRGETGPVPVTQLVVNEDDLQLLAEAGKQLTLFDIWQMPEEQRLVGVVAGKPQAVFGYRVDGNDIILG